MVSPTPKLLQTSNEYPDWVILHIPHDSTLIPEDILDQFCITKDELKQELLLMTDHHTRQLFTHDVNLNRMIYAPVSRLVVDVERFVDDNQEPMSQRGMGVVYTRRANQQPLRRAISEHERMELLKRYYYPRHHAFEQEVEDVLKKYSRCLIIDCHSFSSVPLPYETDQNMNRPQICIGTDLYHTPLELVNRLLQSFKDVGLIVAINEPYSGAIVPLRYYQKEKKVQSIMIEVNRSLYLDEGTGELLPRYDEFRQLINRIINEANYDLN